MGEEKLDNTVYYVRGLYDLADMAAAKRDRATERWARGLADRVARALRRHLVARAQPPVRGFAREPVQRPHPAEALDRRHADGGRADRRRRRRPRPRAVRRTARPRSPGVRTRATAASRPYNRGLFHTGCGGGPTGAGERTIFSLNTAIQAVGLRQLRPRDASRYTGANRAPMFEPDEMPGALPEILPSPDFGDRRTQRPQHRPLLDLPRDVRPGLGPLRHGVAGRAPAARRAAVAGHRARSRSCRSCRPARRAPRAARSGSARARWTCARSASGRRYVTTHPHGRPAPPRPAGRRHAAARDEGRRGHARRAPREAPARARDQPRRRGHRPPPTTDATWWW